LTDVVILAPTLRDAQMHVKVNQKHAVKQSLMKKQVLMTFQEQQVAVLQQIADLVTAKKKIEAQEKELKDKLKEAMEKYSVKKFDSDILKITYVAATTATSIDSAKLKKKYPVIAKECSKTSKKSAYIKVEVKDEK
jgi:hypothetical protein